MQILVIIKRKTDQWDALLMKGSSRRSSTEGLWFGSLLRHFLMNSLQWELIWCHSSDSNETLYLMMFYLVPSSVSSTKGEMWSIMKKVRTPKAHTSTLESPIWPFRTSGGMNWRSDLLVLILVFVKLEAWLKPCTLREKSSWFLLANTTLAGRRSLWMTFLEWSYSST